MEKPKRFSKVIAASLIVMLFALLVLVIYYSQNSTQPKNLYPGEVRDYQGENLSSIFGKTPSKDHNTSTFQPTN